MKKILPLLLLVILLLLSSCLRNKANEFYVMKRVEYHADGEMYTYMRYEMSGNTLTEYETDDIVPWTQMRYNQNGQIESATVYNPDGSVDYYYNYSYQEIAEGIFLEKREEKYDANDSLIKVIEYDFADDTLKIKIDDNAYSKYEIYDQWGNKIESMYISEDGVISEHSLYTYQELVEGIYVRASSANYDYYGVLQQDKVYELVGYSLFVKNFGDTQYSSQSIYNDHGKKIREMYYNEDGSIEETIIYEYQLMSVK